MEHGHMVWLNEIADGQISRCRIVDGNPSDEERWKPGLKAHLKAFHESPQQANGDCGLFLEENEQLAHELGAKRIILPKRGYRSKTRLKHEHKAWFVKGITDMPGRKVALLPSSAFTASVTVGLQGLRRWVGWGVIAGNLVILGRT